MPISYKKLIRILEARGITSYTIKQHAVIGQATLRKIKEGGHIDTRSIESLCKYLKCQPGDLLEYIPDEE